MEYMTMSLLRVRKMGTDGRPAPGAEKAGGHPSARDAHNVFCGNCISPIVETDMANLARQMIRASFSYERMQCLGLGGNGRL
jgi:hypothetical protein